MSPKFPKGRARMSPKGDARAAFPALLQPCSSPLRQPRSDPGVPQEGAGVEAAARRDPPVLQADLRARRKAAGRPTTPYHTIRDHTPHRSHRLHTLHTSHTEQLIRDLLAIALPRPGGPRKGSRRPREAPSRPQERPGRRRKAAERPQGSPSKAQGPKGDPGARQEGIRMAPRPRKKGHREAPGRPQEDPGRPQDPGGFL